LDDTGVSKLSENFNSEVTHSLQNDLLPSPTPIPDQLQLTDKSKGKCIYLFKYFQII